jgi:NADH-quinone oxidoreductase subunit L
MIMLELLWLIPALPLAGFFILALTGTRLSRTFSACVGVGSIGLSAVLSALIGISFITSSAAGHAYSQTLWTWFHVAGLSPEITFYLDSLSLVMVAVVTFVGFLIHLYSAEFMIDEEGYSRFFAYMNLFVSSMLVLVLANNLLLLYLGWEGVGLCSYLLIGFWYKDPVNGRAAMKAFIVTRIGDTSLAIGLFLIYNNLGTLEIQPLMRLASMNWLPGSTLAVAAAALVLGGAVGKSAQLPLQTWLPDAMAGPTPVSALIHAATMVTAGVYLIARMHILFELAPVVKSAVAVIGAVTLLTAGFSALTQKDIKRILAYSTISQIGYMFLALGIGAWSAAIFHFMTHAFYKALLFLGAGVVIIGLGNEHDIFKMGGLRKELPITFWTFLIGASSLSALPLVTAGFYSKDLILWQAWSSRSGIPWLWLAGAAGACLTSLYTFRMVFLIFSGEEKSKLTKKPGLLMLIPLVMLGFLAAASGFIELPPSLGNLTLFTAFMQNSLPSPVTAHYSTPDTELVLLVVAGVLSLAGIFIAYIFFVFRPRYAAKVTNNKPAALVYRLWFSGWGFDQLYDIFIVRPFVWTARINKDDFFDLLSIGIAWYSRLFHGVLSRSQTGKIRWYAMAIAIGALTVIALAVLT